MIFLSSTNAETIFLLLAHHHHHHHHAHLQVQCSPTSAHSKKPQEEEERLFQHHVLQSLPKIANKKEKGFHEHLSHEAFASIKAPLSKLWLCIPSSCDGSDAKRQKEEEERNVTYVCMCGSPLQPRIATQSCIEKDRNR